MLYAREWSQALEKLTSQVERDTVINALSQGYDVIVDATNVTERRLKWWSDLAVQWDAQRVLVWFDIPVGVCHIRNDERTGKARVPEHVIDRMHTQYKSLRRKYGTE